MSDDPNVEAWIDQARSASVLEIAAQLGARLKRSGSDWVGACPRCNGTDRFVISPQQTPQKQFLCRGAGGGDVLAMVMHAANPSADTPFMEACEIINGFPAPQRESQVRPVDPEAVKAREEARRDQELLREQEAQAEFERKADRFAQFFETCAPITGTHGEAYFRLRGLPLYGDVADDLRFNPSVKYRDDEGELVGTFPAVVSAIRDPSRRIIGVHLTYLDPTRPIKIGEPHVPKGSVPKKVWGNQAQGAIYLGPVRPIMAIGEGIETTIAWSLLDHGSLDFGIACAINIGNMAGGSTGTIIASDGRKVPNGIPDMDRPGIRLPPEVEEIILLGDHDLRMENVERHLLTAGRRFRAEGKAVSVHTPDMIGNRKTDWADVLLATTKRAA